MFSSFAVPFIDFSNSMLTQSNKKWPVFQGGEYCAFYEPKVKTINRKFFSQQGQPWLIVKNEKKCDWQKCSKLQVVKFDSYCIERRLGLNVF